MVSPILNPDSTNFLTNICYDYSFNWQTEKNLCKKIRETNGWKILMNSLYVCKIFIFITNCIRICFCYIVFIILISCFIRFIATTSTNLAKQIISLSVIKTFDNLFSGDEKIANSFQLIVVVFIFSTRWFLFIKINTKMPI